MMNTEFTQRQLNMETIRRLAKTLQRWEIEQIVNDLTTEGKTLSINSLYTAIDKTRMEIECICPICSSKHTIKWGHTKGLQRYKCVDCEKTFKPTTNSVFYKTRKNKETWFKFIELTISTVSLRKIASICKINRNTAFDWRHKIMAALSKVLEHNKLKGLVEMDDTFFKQSFKGQKGMRAKEIFKTQKFYSSMICYTTAVDRSNGVVARFNGHGKNSIEKMDKCFTNRIEGNKKSMLLTDCEACYVQFAEKNEIMIHQEKADNYRSLDYKPRKRGELNMNNVNSFYAMLKAMIRRTRGVSSKYLDKYVQWTAWSKQITKLSFGQQLNTMFNDCCTAYI